MKAEELMLALGKIDETLAQECLGPDEIGGTIPESTLPAEEPESTPELREVLAECLIEEQEEAQQAEKPKPVETKVIRWRRYAGTIAACLALIFVGGVVFYGGYKIMGSTNDSNSVIGSMDRKIKDMFDSAMLDDDPYDFDPPAAVTQTTQSTTAQTTTSPSGSTTQGSTYPGGSGSSSAEGEYQRGVICIINYEDTFTMRSNGYTVIVRNNLSGSDGRTLDVTHNGSAVPGAEAESVYNELLQSVKMIEGASLMSEKTGKEIYAKDGMKITVTSSSPDSYDLDIGGVSISVTCDYFR